MRWHRAKTYRKVQKDTDATGNPVYGYEPAGSILVRMPPWAPSRDATAGNEHDEVSRTFLTRSRPDLLDGIAAVEVGGDVYEIEHMTHGACPIAMSARRCKGIGRIQDEADGGPGA